MCTWHSCPPIQYKSAGFFQVRGGSVSQDYVVFAGPFCKWKGFRRLGSSLPSPGQLVFSGGSSSCCLTHAPGGRQDQGGVVAVTRMLCAEDGEGSFALSCPSVSGGLAGS